LSNQTLIALCINKPPEFKDTGTERSLVCVKQDELVHPILIHSEVQGGPHSSHLERQKKKTAHLLSYPLAVPLQATVADVVA